MNVEIICVIIHHQILIFNVPCWRLKNLIIPKQPEMPTINALITRIKRILEVISLSVNVIITIYNHYLFFNQEGHLTPILKRNLVEEI